MADGSLIFDTKIDEKGFTGGLNSITQRLERLKGTMQSIGKGMDTCKEKISGIGAHLKPVTISLKSVAAAAGFAFGAGALIRFGKTATETAAEVNAANSAMAQTFGVLEGAAQSAMQRVAQESGIAVTRLQNAGTQIYAFAKASGMESASALNMTENALRTAADSAAYYDRSLEETTETLKSFLKGNFANDAALGVSCTETTRNIAANKLFAKSYRDLSEAQKQLTLLQMVRDANALSGAEGQAAREAEGWENVIGNLKEAWRQLMAVIGQPVLKIATAAVQELTKWLNTVTEAADRAIRTISAVTGFDLQAGQAAKVTENISESVSAQNALTDAVRKTEAEQKKALSNFDELHLLSAPETGTEESGGSAVTVPAALNTLAAEQQAGALSERLQRLFQPIQIAWEINSPALLAEAKRTFGNLKRMAQDVGKSLSEVWTNGSGERLIGGLIRLAGDFLGIIGDLSGAFADAWEECGRGTAFVQSVSDRWNSLLDLIHAVTSAAREAWNGGHGAAILGDILSILTNINDIWTNLRTQFVQGWNENNAGVRIFSRIFSIIRRVTALFRRLTASTAKWAKSLNFSPLIEAFDDLLAAAEPLVETIGDALASVYENVLLPLGKWTIEKAAPAAIGVLSGAFEVLTAVIEALKPVAAWIWDSFLQPIAEWTGGVIIFVLNSLTELFRDLAKWIRENESVVQGLAVAIGTAIGVFTALMHPIGAVIAAGVLLISHWDDIKEAALNVCRSVAKFFSDCWKAIKGTFAGIGRWFLDRWLDIRNAFSSAAEWFGQIFSDAWQGICRAFSAVGVWFGNRWRDIRNAFSAAAEWFGEIFSDAWQGICDAFSAIGGWFGDRWQDIKDVFTGIAEWFSGIFQDALDAVAKIWSESCLADLFSAVWRGLKGVLNVILSGVESMLNGIIRVANKVIGFLNSISIEIPDWVPDFAGGGKKIGFDLAEYAEVRLPRLATGTVVPAHFGEFAAVLGDNKREPEIVSPVSAMKQAFREALAEHGGTGQQTQIIQLVCDGRKLAEVVRKYQLSTGRVTNGGTR